MASKGAATRVFNITELLEQILIHTASNKNGLQLFMLRTVNHHFHNVIRNSKAVRQYLFIQSPRSPQRRKLNPVFKDEDDGCCWLNDIWLPMVYAGVNKGRPEYQIDDCYLSELRRELSSVPDILAEISQMPINAKQSRREIVFVERALSK